MGIHQGGRFAAITNYRSSEMATAPKSRGNLVKELLLTGSIQKYLQDRLSQEARLYSGFNALSFDGKALFYCSNRNLDINQAAMTQPETLPRKAYQVLKPGFYGLSNGRLNDSWPKIQKGLPIFRAAVKQYTGEEPGPNRLWQLLQDAEQAEDSQLPDTGIGIELERLLSPRFIQSTTYGTRACTLVFWHRNQSVEVIERSFDATGITGEKLATIALNMHYQT